MPTWPPSNYLTIYYYLCTASAHRATAPSPHRPTYPSISPVDLLPRRPTQAHVWLGQQLHGAAQRVQVLSSAATHVTDLLGGVGPPLSHAPPLQALRAAPLEWVELPLGVPTTVQPMAQPVAQPVAQPAAHNRFYLPMTPTVASASAHASAAW